MTVRELTTEAEIRAAWPVMAQLRPNYTEDSFVDAVRRQRTEGYRLAVLEAHGAIVAAAGFRIREMLYSGRQLYVDDLVTDEAARSAGHGRALLEWLKAEARRAHCAELHLDSGTWRTGAHAFYEREGMERSSFHYRIKL